MKLYKLALLTSGIVLLLSNCKYPFAPDDKFHQFKYGDLDWTNAKVIHERFYMVYEKDTLVLSKMQLSYTSKAPYVLESVSLQSSPQVDSTTYQLYQHNNKVTSDRTCHYFELRGDTFFRFDCDSLNKPKNTHVWITRLNYDPNGTTIIHYKGGQFIDSIVECNWPPSHSERSLADGTKIYSKHNEKGWVKSQLIYAERASKSYEYTYEYLIDPSGNWIKKSWFDNDSVEYVVERNYHYWK